jgi:hypothetical protein
VRIGDLIKFINLSYGEPEYLGIILEHHGTWAKIFWCSNFPEKIQDFSILNPDQWVVISETR